MLSVLRFGTGSTLSLELPEEALVAFCDAPRGKPLANLVAAVDEALAEPLEFAPLAQCAVPGDRVVLALNHGVPQAPIFIERVVRVLLAAGVEAREITVLRTAADAAGDSADPLSGLDDEIRRQVSLLVHDPGNREALSYLAATSGAQPIYLHRAIHDADLVISIGCLRPAASLGYHGIDSSVFPTFSDQASIDRYHAPQAVEPAQSERLRKQADEVNWLLGARYTVQIVPGVGGDVLKVLSGDLDAVARAGALCCDEAWSFVVPRRASLVVTTIAGDTSQQTWDNVARALSTAARVVSADGDVAICCDLSEPLGPAIKRLLGAEDLQEARDEIWEYRPRDAWAANELIQALARGKVFLISRLDEELIEELGISPISDEHLSRLAGRYESTIVLANAHYAVAQLRDAALSEPSTRRSKSRK